MRDRLARFEDIPFPGHSFTMTALKTTLEAHLGHSLQISHFPWGVMRLAAPFWELARELGEMRYLWQTPHQLSPKKFESLLPEFEATPLTQVMLAGLPAKMRQVNPASPLLPGATPA
jgi:hypothetical protein